MITKTITTVALVLLSSPIFADQKTHLIVKPTHTMVNGQDAVMYTIEQPDGTWGYHGTAGKEFDAIVDNQTDVPITIHWHGLIVPNDQDGVPFLTQEPIPPHSQYPYHFKLMQSGTYWMHLHYKLQMQQGFFAPLIIKDPRDSYASAKDITLLLSDFSFKTPEAINSELRHSNMDMSPMSHMDPMQHLNMPMSNHAMDLNDVHYDAYLINHHTADDPIITAVTPGELVRLRVIDGASASNFFINLGKLTGQVIATDGNPIKAVNGTNFSISEGQRLDILIKIPNQTKTAYPILAQAEGTNQQTGLILATEGAAIPTLPAHTSPSFGAINNEQDLQFHALHPFKQKSINEKITLSLEGSMRPYVWKINNQVWPHITPIKVKKGDRIQMNIINSTDMSHPIHLHGHIFEVTAVNGKTMPDGPLRDTVLVPPHGKVSVIFDANNNGNWMLHCHVLYHSEDGMMTVMQYEGMPTPKLMEH